MKAQIKNVTQRRRTLRAALSISAVLLVTCDNPLGPPESGSGLPSRTGLSTDVGATATSVVLVGAADIASCSGNLGDEKTAAVIKPYFDAGATVFTAGDNAYNISVTGEPADSVAYANCYNNSWGQFKSRTRPAIGNHEYNSSSTAAPTFDYYGDAALGNSRPKGYYSYDLGAWHIIVLNSNPSFVSTSATSTQVQWLKADLGSTNKTCTMAMWHDPRFYSGNDPSLPPPAPVSSVKPFWDALYAAGADLILNGHRHVYERFAPQDPNGNADGTRGIRQINIGTGGRGNGPVPTVLRPNSVAQYGGEGKFGVLKLTLDDGTYSWEFLGVAGVTYNDKGTANCHKMPSGTPNAPPTASFTSSCTGLACTFNSSASADGDGTIASRTWEFGDGTTPATTTSATQTHTYAAAGTYSVKLTVTDDDNATSSVTNPVTVTTAQGNIAPTASFTVSCTDLKCSFSSRSSTDPDGTIVSRFWTFGNGSTSTSDSTTRTYAAPGTYTVTLKVTDDDGATNTASKAVTVPTSTNAAPTAAFTWSCTNLSCTFTDGSTDTDGTIASRSWNFGDGSPAATTTPASHTYAAAGSYDVTLTVTDNGGARATKTQSVTVTAANAAPTAAFTPSCTNLSCTFTDQSTDTDGTIASWGWNFGDGTTSTATNPPKTYSAAGTYTVQLTVTDNRGGTGTTTKSVTVSAANAAPTAVFTWDCPAGGRSCTFTDASTDSDGSIKTWKWEFGDGVVITEVTSTNPTHDYAADGLYTVKLTVTDDGGAEHTASQSVRVGETPANSPPVAAFTPSCTGLSCTFDDQSTDPDGDGTIVSRNWDYGDGTTGTAASHTYATGKTYNVKLTVTDDGGETNSVFHDVTVSPANAAPTASFTSSCSNLSCTFNSSGSSDSDGTIASRSWNFGDGTTSTATSPAKTYAAAGTYTVRLTVTDNAGATGTTTKTITVSAAAANAAPKAFFGSACTKLVCKFTDRSTDADGNSTIVKWSWTFGDGKSFSTTVPANRHPSHTYAAGGTYSPKLTVTDNKGATGSIVHAITIAP